RPGGVLVTSSAVGFRRACARDPRDGSPIDAGVSRAAALRARVGRHCGASLERRRRRARDSISTGCEHRWSSSRAVHESDTRRGRHRGIHPSARLTVCERPTVANEWPLAETRDVSETRRYRTFGEFYPFYLSEHSNRTCRRLHFVGTTIGL